MQPAGREILCENLVTPTQPSLPVLQFAAIDADSQIVAIVSMSGKVHVHHIPSANTYQLALEQKRMRTWLAAAGGYVTLCHQSLIETYSINSNGELFRCQQRFPDSGTEPRVCALSADAGLLGLVSKNTATGSYFAQVFNHSNWESPLQTWNGANYEYINFSPDGSATFLLGDRHFVAFDTHTGAYLTALPIDRNRRNKHYMKVACDQSKDNVAVIDSETLRLWNINNPQQPAKILPGYRPPGFLSIVGACAISNDGSRVVAALPRSKFGVWNTVTCSYIATLVGHEINIFACAITSDATSIITVASNFEIRTWKMPVDDQPQQTPAHMPYSSNSESFQINKIVSWPLQSEQQFQNRLSQSTSTIPQTNPADVTDSASNWEETHIKKNATWSIQPEQQVQDIQSTGNSALPQNETAPADATRSSLDSEQAQLERHATWSVQSEQQVENTHSTDKSTTPPSHAPPDFTILECAFAKILSDPTLLDTSFITDHISANNVNTASDLLAGHNIILFAIRTGVITRNNINTIGGSSWYLQDNLYLPASKLTGENSHLLDAIFYHAESLGIVKDGNKYKMAREIRSDLQNDLQMVGQAVSDLAERMCHLERRVDHLEAGMQNVHDKINQIALNEQKMQEAVKGLSEALQKLQDSIHKKNKRNKYAVAAKCLLNLIPLFGQALGEVAVTAAEVFTNLNKKDLVSLRTHHVESITTHVAQVDLGNLQMARYAFSQKVICKLTAPAQDAVLGSVRQSGFRSVDEVEKLFVTFMSDVSSEEESIALLDIGSSAWLSEPRRAVTAGSSSQGADSLDEGAQKYFQFACVKKGKEELNIEETKVELNRVLEQCHGLKGIDEDTVENMFFDLADEDAEMVSEGLFVEMFRQVRKDQEKQNTIFEEWRQRFRQRADPKPHLSFRMAARLLCNLDKWMVDRGTWKARKCADARRAEQVLKAVDANESGNIDEGEFMSALQGLLRAADE